VPASAVWTIAAKSPGESLWNLVKNHLLKKLCFSKVAISSQVSREIRQLQLMY
jgi:hypothetical protein